LAAGALHGARAQQQLRFGPGCGRRKRRAAAMNNFLERHLEGLGGPKPKNPSAASYGKRSPAAPPASLPQGAGLPVFEKRVQLKESLPAQARGSPLKDGTPPRTISPEPEIPKRQVLKAQTPLPKIRPPPDYGHQPYQGPGSGLPQGGAIAALGWRNDGPPPPGTAAATGSPSLAPMGGGASTRSMMSGGLPTSQRTASPSGRMHPNPTRRAELRKADMFHNIDYYGGHGAPDNDRLVKEASWLSTQSWFESLRYYPKGEDADDDETCYSGLTHGMSIPSEHLETDVRTRLGIAKAGDSWGPDQLQMQWLPESAKLLKRLRKSYLKLRR